MARAAEAAAALIADRAGRGRVEWEVKGHLDFVSEVDRAAEEAIRDSLVGAFPGAPIVGEELTPGAGVGGPLVFVVDPLDGTTNFLHGYPEYAVSIAALADGQPVAGIVRNVPLGETFTATGGGGARLDGRPISVSTIADPARALLGTGFPFRTPDLVPPYVRQLAAIMRTTSGIRRAGSAALDLCDVACGRLDAFWELHLAAWDTAAGMLIVREAGGLVTDLEGRDAPVAGGPIVAGNPEMHAWLLQTLFVHPNSS